MFLSAVTDEVTPDRSADAFPKIFSMAAEQGVKAFEIRMVEAKRFPITEPEAWVRLKKYGREYGIDYTVASPGCYKVSLDHDLIGIQPELLSMSYTAAEALGISKMVTFGVGRSASDTDADFERVVDLLGTVADTAAARGFEVLLENLPGTWADTGENCLRLLEGVGRANFGYIWDVGNLYEAEDGRDFRTSYELLRPHIRDVHLKDGDIVHGRMEWMRFGTGGTDIAGQIEVLRRDGYAGALTVETKCEPHHDDDFVESMTYLRAQLEPGDIAA